MAGSCFKVVGGWLELALMYNWLVVFELSYSGQLYCSRLTLSSSSELNEGI